MNRIFAFVLLTFGFASASHAIPTTWTDSADVGSGVYIGHWQSYTYTHDLTDTGFNPLTDEVQNFSLAINLADDGRPDIFGIDIFEWTFVDMPGNDGDVWNFFGLSGEEYGGFSVEGLAELNSLGTLTVTIYSLLGDFYLRGSTLTAHGESNVANVPEPGVLGLLGIGLVGIALSKRRRKQAA